MLPIRVRQAPNFVSALIRRARLLQQPAQPQRRFHLCYFSCYSYFAYLYCAIDSVARHVKQPCTVYLFNDQEQPLSDEQIERLRERMPDLKVFLWPKSMGWGAAQIQTIWQAYGLAAEQAADDDIIARVDSDVFFFNDRIFQVAQRSEADVIGDGHFVGFEYSQGGCYFLKASAVRRINAWLARRDMDEALAGAAIKVEDVAMHHFARSVGLDILLTWFMMFPDELRNAGGLTAWQRYKFSCLHFVMKNKRGMLDAYLDQVLAPAERGAFLAAAGLPAPAA
ncbi:glycosyltransferase [Pelomonas cellulosilytica]|uniref:Glycosyltransferase n=1 Tax=Pelomonas cellulosilytica TaxID=2906762 RepID=A0ABS8Y590_9BURK|nr:glycosyltransferase [Pelomonas sp. P8]MCE4557565.1 glycosyltransferase [Pelomonas sp. P8]